MTEFLFKLLLAYLLGSISGSLLIGKLRGGVDIRGQGSGNAGATNALRTQGVGFALGVILIDVGKGVLAAGPLAAMALPFAAAADPGMREWIAPCCGALAVIGHIYPIWHGFRGGKGAGTWIGAIAALTPWSLLPFALVWIGVAGVSGFVGLATMCAAVAVPVFLALSLMLDLPGSIATLIVATGIAVLSVYAHRANIGRMRAGTENRLSRSMFGRRDARTDNG